MSSEYNSTLISKLYKLTNEEKIIEVLDEIGEIGDPVFLYPILDIFNRPSFSTMKHYFIVILGKIKSKETNEVLEGILDRINLNTSRADLLPWVLDAMDKLSYYSSKANNLAINYISRLDDVESRKVLEISEYVTDMVLDYLKNAKEIEKCDKYLMNALFGENPNKEEKRRILGYLLKINTVKQISYLIENYENRIKNNVDLELIIVKGLLGWAGPKTAEFKELVSESGSGRAKEIISEEKGKRAKEEVRAEKDIQKKELVVFRNSGVVTEIAEIRNRINRKTQASKNFGFPLFPEKEILFTFIKSADSASLRDFSSNLRSLINAINEKIREHGYSIEEEKSMLSTINEEYRKKSLNQLYLFLKSRSLTVDLELYGLKDLNRIVSLMVHPELEKSLLIFLEKNDKLLLGMYKNNEAGKFQRHLLGSYEESLKKLEKELP